MKMLIKVLWLIFVLAIRLALAIVGILLRLLLIGLILGLVKKDGRADDNIA